MCCIELEPRRAVLHFPGEAIDESLESISSSDPLNAAEQQKLLDEASHRLSYLSDSVSSGVSTCTSRLVTISDSEPVYA